MPRRAATRGPRRRAAGRRARSGPPPSTAAAGSAAIRSSTPSARASRGPSPDGVQATSSAPAYRLGAAHGARHRSADQPEPQERHAHAPSIGEGAAVHGGGRLRARPARRDPLRAGPQRRRGTVVSSTDHPGDGAAHERSPSRPETPNGSRPVRVLLVDDHRLILESLARVLNEEPDIDIVGTATTVSEAKDAALEPVDVVLMDYRLPDGTGVEATRAIKARWPTCADHHADGDRRRRDGPRVDPGRRRRLPHEGQGHRGRRRDRSRGERRARPCCRGT